jgi:hypothetical protein
MECPVVQIHFCKVTVRGKAPAIPGVAERRHNDHLTDSVALNTVSTFLHCYSSSLATIVSVPHTAYGSVSWSQQWHALLRIPSIGNQKLFYCAVLQ